MIPLQVALPLALLVILPLAFYALHLWRLVWAQRRRLEEARRERHARLGGDLRILAGSLLDEQLPLIEGAIRIKVLMDNYDVQLSQDARMEVFHRLYQATEHVPTHAAWKALPAAEKRHHEAHFSALELQHKAAARQAARWLLDEGLDKPADAA